MNRYCFYNDFAGTFYPRLIGVRLKGTKEVAQSPQKDTDTAKNPAASEDNLLIQQYLKGDSAAMEKLILRYQDRIYNVILKICANPHDAAELSQDVFVKAIENVRNFKQKSAFYTWLFRIAVNLTISHCKRKAKVRFHPIDEQYNQESEEGKRDLKEFLQDKSSPDPAAVAQKKELCDLVLRTLEKLPEEHKVVLILRDVEGMDYARIADILGIELGTVKSRLSRARSNLKEFLEIHLE